MTRPSETITAVVGSVIGAVLVILGAVTDVSKITPEVAGAIVLLISWIATVVTAVVASKQRDGDLTSGRDGTVE